MAEQRPAPGPGSIVYNCYGVRSRAGEQVVSEHVFTCQLAGTMHLDDGRAVHAFGAGEYRLLRRNQLVRFTKYPPEGGEFRSLSVFLDQPTLRALSLEYGYRVQQPYTGPGVVALTSSPLLKSYLDSLRPYEQLGQPGNGLLLSLKLREAILLLLNADPGLKDLLFDFTEPGKVDLEAFMNTHFHFNVDLKRFAYLTGRSLATFKRDFEKIFHTSPGRWLQQRRLQEAYRRIREKGATPSEVYLEVGFEDLSHFSFAFKKAYGVAPSRL